jgi:PKD repeat protein
MQAWLNRIIDLSGYSDTVKIRFKAKKGSGKYSDICVDKVQLYDTCFVQDPIASFTFKLDSLNAQGQYVSFTSTSLFSTEYLWGFGDGSLDTGTAVQHIYAANGTFVVQHIVINDCDVTDTITDTVNVNGVGIDNYPRHQLEFSVFPNPADDMVYVELPVGLGAGSVKLVNSVGNTLLAKSFEGNARIEINTATITSGFYIIKFESDQYRVSIPLLIN